MAKLALTVIGMGVGFMIGGPMGAQIGAMAGGMIGSMLFSPTIKGPRMTDLSVTASTYGNTIPELYGTMRMSGNVIWSPGIKEHKHKSGGLGGKGGPKQVTYTYTASYAIAFCRGEVENITRIWADGKLIAGAKPNETAGPLSMAGVLNLTKKSKGKFKYRFYRGTEDQRPDSTIIADKGANNVPGYRDLCYLVFIDQPLEDFGNRIPQITAEITRSPVIAAPYVNLSSDTSGGYADPGTQWESRGDVDWVNNQFYKLVVDNVTGKEYFVHYDLRTMAELFRVEVQPVSNGDTPNNYPSFNPAFSIGGNYFFANTSLGNSGTAQIWDATSGYGLGNIGHRSNTFPSTPQENLDVPFSPDGALIGTWDAQAMWFRTLNDFGQSDLVYHVGNLGTRAIVWTPDCFPAHWLDFGGTSSFFGNAATWTPMRGKEVAPTLTSIGNSDMLFLTSKFIAGVGWDVHLKVLNMVDGAVMTGGVLSNNFLNTETDLPLPRPFAGLDFAMTNCAYDKSDNSIVIWGTYGADNLGNGGTWCFVKYLIDEGTYLWAKKDTDLDPKLASSFYTAAEMVGAPTDSATQSNLDGGTVGWMRPTMLHTNSALYVADLQNGEITVANLASPLAAYADNAWAMNAWDDQTQSVMGAPTRVFVKTEGHGVALQAIVDDVLTRTGALEPGVDWDSSALANIFVHGYAISRDASAKDVLNQLAAAYFFDGVESDYIIKMSLRGGSPIATIHEKHLSWVENRDNWLAETRTQEVELPMRVTVNYSDTDRDYQAGTQSAKRNSDPFPTMHSHTEGKIDFPIAMKATDAKRIADKTLKMSWANRWQYKLKMPWEMMKYDPTDILTIESDAGFGYQMRFAKMVLGVDFTIQADGVSEKPAAYTSAVEGDPGSGVPVQVIAGGGPIDLFVLNTPLLRDSDDTQGIASVFYATAKSKSPGDFSTAYLFEATDGTGTEYDNIDVFTTEPTWGMCQTVLPPHMSYSIDSSTVLTVRIMSLDSNDQPDTLESCTIDELLAGRNAAFVGKEIIQYMTATPRGDGRTYDLTDIVRARRGTNYVVRDHVAGETFITLDSSTLVKEINQPAEWASKHLFKGVSAGQFEEDVFPLAVEMQPNDLKPYTPEFVRCGDDGTNVTIDFERRSRISNEITDGTGDIPYREGQGTLAKVVYKVYVNKTLADTPWVAGIADFTGNVPIYSGVSFAALTLNFPLVGVNQFVVQLYEVGFVDGFPKYVHFKRERANDWAMTELY